MLVDISDLIWKKIKKKEINMSFEGKKFVFDGQKITFVEPVMLEGIFTMAGDIINYDGKVKVTLRLVCSRCLENFDYPLEIEIHERFSKLDNTEDNDIIVIDDDKVDFSPIIEDNIILSLPIKKLCNSKCKGLCPVCGTNLNYSKCKCEKDEIDPRLAKLKYLFPDN
ncbi:DUF177 domain-containing protein [Clostridium aestuarii]|uniref:DUF177 domain-containing protein n=1 Tax=Clostridium aestuarii TaxID=338193 RepID=A0ABT4D1Q8_9CLOT|nr:DUF177 domain-containing protein [Clostridium aestuarii]MCY6483983.1 DUF177 domain-containing protein [Clostridium aestuarii]